MVIDINRLISPATFAALRGLSLNTVYVNIHRGKLKPLRIEGKPYFVSDCPVPEGLKNDYRAGRIGKRSKKRD